MGSPYEPTFQKSESLREVIELYHELVKVSASGVIAIDSCIDELIELIAAETRECIETYARDIDVYNARVAKAMAAQSFGGTD